MNHTRRSIALLCLGAAVAAAPASARAQAPVDAGTADARLRSLYGEEWNWRQREMGRGENGGGRFAPVDAATQAARLDYWTKALRTLEGIPYDQLSPEEK